MISKTWLLGAVLSAALFVAACSGDDGDLVGLDDTSVPSVVERSNVDGRASDDDGRRADVDGVDSTSSAAAGTGAPAASIEEFETQWAATRDRIVGDLTAKIDAGEYGLGDDGIVRGAGGLEIDTNACQGDWSDSRGVTDTSIRIGHTTAQSGNLAAYGNIGSGMNAYFTYVNYEGGVGGRAIELVSKDDAYVAANTIASVDELIAGEDVLSVTTLGTPNTLAVYDKLNTTCTPHLFVMSGHQAWGDPANHPWTMGVQLPYSSEALIWGEWIRTNLTEKLPVSVSGLVMDNEFGFAFEQSFQRFADANPDVVQEFVAVRHDPAAANLTEEMTTIAGSEPNVFIAMTAGNPCLLAVQEAEAVGLRSQADALFVPSVCNAVAAYMAPAGDAADGWQIAAGGWKDMTDASTVGDVYMDFVRAELERQDLDVAVSLYGTGFAAYGFPYVETLRIADELPGGLTRTNLVLAARHLSLDHPGLVDGIAFTTSGGTDAYPVEGSDILRFDAASQNWMSSGAVVDVDGSSPPCDWDATGSTGCR